VCDPAQANSVTECGSTWPIMAFVSHPLLVTTAQCITRSKCAQSSYLLTVRFQITFRQVVLDSKIQFGFRRRVSRRLATGLASDVHHHRSGQHLPPSPARHPRPHHRGASSARLGRAVALRHPLSRCLSLASPARCGCATPPPPPY